MGTGAAATALGSAAVAGTAAWGGGDATRCGGHSRIQKGCVSGAVGSDDTQDLNIYYVH